MSVSARSVTDHKPSSDEHTNAIVYVNGTRIPVGNVDVYIRKEGPLDFTRYVEAEFPAVYQGVDYASVFDGFKPSQQGSWDRVSIGVREYGSEEFYRSFHGVVTGVGNAADGGERWMAFRAQGPGHFLDKIPAKYTADNAMVTDIMQYVARELQNHIPFSISIDAPKQSVRPGTTVSNIAMGWQPIIDPSKFIAKKILPINSPKTWHFGKDTLADVIQWTSEKTELTIWLGVVDDGLVFVGTDSPNDTQHRATHLGGDLNIFNNDALAELRPVNTQLVKAPAKESRGGEENKASEKYVEVKAVHEGLYRRAGDSHLHADVHRMSDAVTKNEAEKEARKLLKKKINETREGDMQTFLRPTATPFDTVEARPTCRGKDMPDATAITYEVNRVHHEVTADEIPETKLNVGVHVDTGDITVLDSWEKSP